MKPTALEITVNLNTLPRMGITLNSDPMPPRQDWSAIPTRFASSQKLARPNETTRWKPAASGGGETGVEKEDRTLDERSKPGEKSRGKGKTCGSMEGVPSGD
jgi:hypothetical protein